MTSGLGARTTRTAIAAGAVVVLLSAVGCDAAPASEAPLSAASAVSPASQGASTAPVASTATETPPPLATSAVPATLERTPTAPATRAPTETPTPAMIYKTIDDHPPGSRPIFSPCWPLTSPWDIPPRNFAQWSLDGSEIYFTHAAEVYVAAVDGSRLRRIATAWTEETNSGERVGGVAPFHVALGGGRLVYATCEYSEPHRGPGPQPSPWDHQQDLVVVSLDGTQRQRLTATRNYESHPAWSPDGAHIAYVSTADPRLEVSSRLYVLQTEGAVKRTLRGEFDFVARQPPAWSPDGRWLAVTGVSDEGAWIAAMQESRRLEGKGRWTIHLIAMPNGDEVIRLSDAVSGASWSPDGQRLAFAKSDGDEVALYTVAADGTDARRLTTITGWQLHSGGYEDWDPTRAWIKTVSWSPDGTYILYTCGAREICVVTPHGTPVGRTPLTAREPTDALAAAWMPDGSRIAIVNNEGLFRKSGYRPDPIAFYTMAPDGTDPLVLMVLDRDGNLHPIGPRQQEESVDVAGCATGTVVLEPAAHPGLIRDCETLLRVRDAFAGTAEATGAAVLDWSTDLVFTRWEGVTIDGSPPRVTELILEHRGLWGVIPPALGELTRLRVLDLRSNHIRGDIPPELGELAHLRVLDLGSNKLSGTIPPELGRLTQLSQLHLFENYLSGTIPPTLGKLTSLTELRLGGNYLNGPIPPELSGLSQLQALSLGDNQVTGPIPAGLGHLAHLEVLDLTRNELTGAIPAEFVQLANLRTLTLGENQLTDCIPAPLRGIQDNDLASLGLPDCGPR